MQVEQKKYEARILGLQRAKQEAAARAAKECGKVADMGLQIQQLQQDKQRSACA